MPNNGKTIFQNLSSIMGINKPDAVGNNDLLNTSLPGNEILFATNDKAEYERKLNQYKQEKYLAYQWQRAQVENNMESLASYTAVKLMYRDSDLMDGVPEIGTALDIISDETCLHGDTEIKLLNGETHTIRELFANGYADFWCYSVDENGICKPTHIDKVIHKGKKEIYKISLDDGTEIKCTPEHRWLLTDGRWVETVNIKPGDSLMSIYDSLNYLGYEQIKSSVEGKKRLTHRVVAEDVLREEKEKLVKDNHPYQKIVIHHNTFNKLNNDPSALTYMYWNDHQKLHTDLNQKRWENEEFAEKMKNIFSETAKKTWKRCGENLRMKKSKSMHKYFDSLTTEEKKEKYGKAGEKNNMFGVHRYGSSNPNYAKDKKHIEDISESEYIDALLSYSGGCGCRKYLSEKFNMPESEVIKYNLKIAHENGKGKISQVKSLIEEKDIFTRAEHFINTANKVTVRLLSDYLGYSRNHIKHIFQKNGKSFEDMCNDICNKTNEKYLYSKINGGFVRIAINDYEKYLFDNVASGGSLIKKISEHFGITVGAVKKNNSTVVSKYGVKNIMGLRYVCGVRFSDIKEFIRKNPNALVENVCKEFGISYYVLNNMLKSNGYNGFIDLKAHCYNHRVVAVEALNEIDDVYDLFNSTTNNCFAVKCKTGHIISHNCNLSSDNQLLKISSKSKRIKSILEDLFYNRLQIATTLRMITRGMVKYGNHYMLLNVTKNGIAGWRQLSVYETDRYEGGLSGYYGGGQMINAGEDLKPDEVRFVHAGMNQSTSYSEWQVAHFRLLNDSFFLPYGVSLLHKARRAWRMWSMMEDAMLIYRLDKSIERRVFKIYVGGINDKDVPAFVQEIANNFKRTPIIDPMTGQVDLRKNFLDVSSDYFIPVRDPNAPNPIETLQSAHNDTAMDDINYMQNKIFAAIRVPKQFINFQDAQGKGQNLSLADIRFARMIMGIQQFVLAELNKVAMVHLYLLGFKEELTNFSLAMNIPTAQIESLELDALMKRIQTASAALADPGIGMPMVSLHWVQTNILKLSDNEIKDILGEIRLEKAMAAELQATPMIIKKTGMFDAVDNIYGDYEAMNNPQQQQPQQDQGMGGLMGGSGGLGGSLGGDLGGGLGGDMDLDGTPDSMEGGGATGSTDMGSAPAASSGQPLQERKSVKSVIDQYLDMLTEKQKEREDDSTDGAYVILEQSEKEAKDLDFLIEKVENLIKDDEAFKGLGVEDEDVDDGLSGETVSDEDLLNDEE